MTVYFSSGLQAAIYQTLKQDATVSDLVGEAVFDAPPEGVSGELPREFVSLGAETVRPLSTKTSRGSVHDFVVSVHSERNGFEAVKDVAGAVCECLTAAELQLPRGTLVDLRFLRARASRGMAPEKRRIDLRFRATIDED
ncbi:DUF3168 domain-containing protein [Amaricoccus tamworthensis]|uniref:DUF3168 domain-containing protein n=1 Tax=Amaricoccus tamworthensis TaxID=57002 RepID=UPI003C7DF482